MKRLLARGPAPVPAERAVLRPDGTLRRPVTIRVVRHGDDLYVRSWRGRTGAWFRGAQDGREGHISADKLEHKPRDTGVL